MICEYKTTSLHDILIEEAGLHGFDELSELAKQRKRDSTEPLLIMVAGEGKHGKSTLINALVGRDIAPVGRLPKTWKVDLYQSYHGNEQACIYWKSKPDSSTTVSIPEAFDICNEEEKKCSSGTSASCETWRSDLYQVRWKINTDWPDSGVVLVDTPGFSQLRADTSVENLRLYGSNGIQYACHDGFEYYYARADIVLWCINGGKLEDQDTLDALIKVSDQRKQIVGVLTRMDQIPAERWEEIRSRAEEVYGEYISEFIFSAAGAKDALIRAQCIANLRQIIDERFVAKALVLKEECLRKSLKQDIEDFSAQLDAVMDCYIINATAFEQVVNELHAIVYGAFDRSRASLSDIWHLAEQNAGLKLESLYNQFSNHLPSFADAVENHAIDKKYLEDETNRIILSAYNEVYSGIMVLLQQIEWQAVSLGGKSTTVFTQQIGNLTNSGLAFRSVQASSLHITGNEGTGIQNTVGLVAGIAGGLIFGPIGIAAALLGLIAGNAAKRAELLSKANHSVLEFCESNLTSALSAIDSHYAEIEEAILPAIEKSFTEHHGRDLDGIWNHAACADCSINRLSNWQKHRERIPWPYGLVPVQLIRSTIGMQSERHIDKETGEIYSCYQFALSKVSFKYAELWQAAVLTEWEKTAKDVLDKLMVQGQGPFSEETCTAMVQKCEDTLFAEISRTCRRASGYRIYDSQNAAEDIVDSGVIDWFAKLLPDFNAIANNLKETRIWPLHKTMDIDTASYFQGKYDTISKYVLDVLKRDLPSDNINAPSWLPPIGITVLLLLASFGVMFCISNNFEIYSRPLILVPFAILLVRWDYKRQEKRFQNFLHSLTNRVLASVIANARTCATIMMESAALDSIVDLHTGLVVDDTQDVAFANCIDQTRRASEDSALFGVIRRRAAFAYRLLNEDDTYYDKAEAYNILGSLQGFPLSKKIDQIMRIREKYPDYYMLDIGYYSQLVPAKVLENSIRKVEEQKRQQESGSSTSNSSAGCGGCCGCIIPTAVLLLMAGVTLAANLR